jgi:hypothetical protein
MVRDMTSYKSNLVEFNLFYVGQTERGLCVRRDDRGDDGGMFWLPKSQIEFDDKDYKRHEEIKVVMPEWLARSHNLV